MSDGYVARLSPRCRLLKLGRHPDPCVGERAPATLGLAEASDSEGRCSLARIPKDESGGYSFAMQKNIVVQLSLASLAIAATLLSSSNAWACSCTHATREENLKAADAVFWAKTIGVTDGIARMRVRKWFKGKKRLEIIRIRSSKESLACEHAFTKGRSYMVFAWVDDKGVYKTSTCTSTYATEYEPESALKDPDGRGREKEYMRTLFLWAKGARETCDGEKIIVVIDGPRAKAVEPNTPCMRRELKGLKFPGRRSFQPVRKQLDGLKIRDLPMDESTTQK